MFAKGKGQQSLAEYSRYLKCGPSEPDEWNTVNLIINCIIYLNLVSYLKHQSQAIRIHASFKQHTHTPVADLTGGTRDAPPTVQILSISCSLWENFAKLYVGAPSGELVPPQGNPGSATAHTHTHKHTYCQRFNLYGEI